MESWSINTIGKLLTKKALAVSLVKELEWTSGGPYIATLTEYLIT